jgi:hypothetical protein
MVSDQLLNEIKRGDKPSDELKDYLRKSSASRFGAATSRPRVGPGRLRNHWKKFQRIPSAGSGILLPCLAEKSLAMAAPNLQSGHARAKGYTVASDLQLGVQVGEADYPGVQIPLHQTSSYVDATTGEFSLCAGINNIGYYKDHLMAPYGSVSYPSDLDFGGYVEVHTYGYIAQIFNTPTIFQKKPTNISATAVLSADHILSSIFTFCGGAAGTFAGVYGWGEIDLFSLFGNAPSAYQPIDFLVHEMFDSLIPASNFSSLDDGPQTVSVIQPWDGKTEWFIVKVTLSIECVIIGQGYNDDWAHSEAAFADFRLTSLNETMIYPDLSAASFQNGFDPGATQPSPIVLDSLTLCVG